MPAYKSENPNPTTLIAKMTKVCPYYVGKYVEWYLTPPDERQSWDDLCKCDNHFQNKSGENRTEKFCKENWLVREDAQAAIKIYMKHMQTVNTSRSFLISSMVVRCLRTNINNLSSLIRQDMVARCSLRMSMMRKKS